MGFINFLTHFSKKLHGDIEIPIVRLGDLGRRGLVHRDIYESNKKREFREGHSKSENRNPAMIRTILFFGRMRPMSSVEKVV